PAPRASSSSQTRRSTRPSSRAATATSHRPPNKKAAPKRGLGSREDRLRGSDQPFHLLKRLRLALADPLRGGLELGHGLVQRGRVLLAQPARFYDAAAARVQAGNSALQAARPQRFFLPGLDELGGPGRTVGQIGDRRVGLVVVGRRLERNLLPG